ncbi:hypothetical protein [Pedobacter nototheniae]|uniref:hypothetical protein n=1 Tax=Pedobacter nototheniae TaxID=2488994 RepID=UPI0029302372|nr:hypothetical protein [Pedobacter nototheniae]
MDFLKNWIPYKLNYDSGVWDINWLDLSDHKITEPFFDETISICRFKMLNRSKYWPQSSTEFLTESSKLIEGITPVSFIFHVSRCGSTLLSQLLSTRKENIVIAEAPVIDEILTGQLRDERLSDEQIEEWLKATLNLLGQKRTGDEKHFFIKLDSWHIHFYDKLRKWFPNTPFYFLSRAPQAIIASHAKRRGIHSVPGMVSAKLLKIELNELHNQDFNFYTSEVLKQYYFSLLDIAKAGHALDYFFDYSWGMERMAENFFDVIGLKNEQDASVLARLKYHSKYPNQVFAEEKSNVAPDAFVESINAYHNLLSIISIANISPK